jgi:hypothetical protein
MPSLTAPGRGFSPWPVGRGPTTPTVRLGGKSRGPRSLLRAWPVAAPSPSRKVTAR